MKNLVCSLLLFVVSVSFVSAEESETFPPLVEDQVPNNLEQMWGDFDPRAEPLEIEVLKEWEEDNVLLRIVRFRVGVFKGETAKLAAVYGFPKSAANGVQKLPGLVQIHGGGQYADHRACLANAKRGYATVSISWAGRISAPEYTVSPTHVKLFWEGKTNDPQYRETTDWGAVDAYHANGRNRADFRSLKPTEWTIDSVESPRNSPWFLCAVAARRALTFLEQQPEVDADRLGVYGHSMGGKLTVMASVDSRVKAAAPSCGGISDRYNSSPLFRSTIGDDVSLKQIKCPIIFLSPANDFHGRLGDLPTSVKELKSQDWRVTCSPHHNHQDTAPYEVATMLWMDQHLKKTFQFPQTPAAHLTSNSEDGIPSLHVRPDQSRPVQSVDVYYTQHGKAGETQKDMQNVMHRFWHHALGKEQNGVWSATLPIGSVERPLWVYANVTYALDEPVSGAGYYYGIYNTDSFNVSSFPVIIESELLRQLNVRATLESSLLIEDFKDDWQKEWFTYRPAEWARTTFKLHDDKWKAPKNAKLALEIRSDNPNQFVVVIDSYAAQIELTGGTDYQAIELELSDFRSLADKPLPSWDGISVLKLTHAETLRPQRGEDLKPRTVGKTWLGTAPEFRNLRWK